jgi:catechol 2,3-dioxygenase-like lactoylglutathione lyase family enzyme
MPIDHIGLGVPDVEVAKAYYDELLGRFGFVRQWEVGYRPTDWQGVQVFLYPALEPGPYSRHGVGLQHLSYYVGDRAEVDAAHAWAVARGHEIVHAPKPFPEYGEHCYSTFFLDVHGFMIEATTHAKPTESASSGPRT